MRHTQPFCLVGAAWRSPGHRGSARCILGHGLPLNESSPDRWGPQSPAPSQGLGWHRMDRVGHAQDWGRGRWVGTHISRCCWRELRSLHSGQVTNRGARVCPLGHDSLNGGPHHTCGDKCLLTARVIWQPRGGQQDVVCTQASGMALIPATHSQSPGPPSGSPPAPPHPTPCKHCRPRPTRGLSTRPAPASESPTRSSAAQPGGPRTCRHQTGATAKPGAGTPTQRVCPWVESISFPTQGSLRSPALG